ncbi:hypothetical protein BU24DRAFT_422063, partial [Aaosphaeria arxii CBS 175.79]
MANAGINIRLSRPTIERCVLANKMSEQTPNIRTHPIDRFITSNPPNVINSHASTSPISYLSRSQLEAEPHQPVRRSEARLLPNTIEPWAPPRKSLRKMPKSSTLSLAMRTKGGKDNVTSPLSPRSPGSPNAVYGADSENSVTPTGAYHNEVPASPASPKLRKDSKSIFSNFGATKSSTRVAASPDNSIRQVPEQDGRGTFYTNGKQGGSTPELTRPVQTSNSEDHRADNADTAPRSNSGSGRSHDTPDRSQDSTNRTTTKPKKQGVLTRSKSIKVEETASSRAKLKANPPKISPDPGNWRNPDDSLPLKTAPLEKGQSWRQNIAFGKLRTHSADRHEGSRDEDVPLRKERAEQSSLASNSMASHSMASNSYNESRGATLMSSLGSGARKMGEKMETARKGMFGKLGRSSSNHEREPQIPKEPYQFKIIHQPLVEQTRLTRISNRLESSRDKTEFWMPALPWRCIDYLNMRGCEEEGLYRVPGAAHTVKYYEQKFDQDRDIDLISDDNLNDPNVIGSLFKNWLRQLPDDIFPKATQARIQQECQGAKTTPQMLKDELSKLPPFNYYLLFAITCHISLLHSCSEFNKMNYNNLCICFQPAIKIDAFCFQFLILDWRNCWQGCWTEKEFLDEEVRLLEVAQLQAEAQAQAQAQAQAVHPPSRNGHTPAKAKGSHLGDAFKKSGRSDSKDRSKGSTRGVSADRSIASSGRATPPEKSSSSRRGVPSREPSTDRAISSSHSRDVAVDTRATPRRAPTATLGPEIAVDDDESATPTQAQHNRAESETQFRLDLNHPPSSPFSI